MRAGLPRYLGVGEQGVGRNMNHLRDILVLRNCWKFQAVYIIECLSQEVSMPSETETIHPSPALTPRKKFL